MQINMFDAKSRLSSLVQAVLEGKEVVLARNGKPVARIVPYRPTVPRRKPGALKGLIWMSPDWDSPETNRRIAQEMEAHPLEPPEAQEPWARYRAARRKRRR